MFLSKLWKQFWKSRWKEFDRKPLFSVHWPKKMKKFSFFEFFFLKKPLHTNRIQFWQPRWKEKDRSPKKTINVANQWVKKWVFPKLLFWKCFYGRVYCSIDNTVEKVSTENRHAVAPCLKMFQKSFQKNFILITFSQRTRRIQVSQSRRKNSDRKGFALDSEKMKKVFILGFFSEKVFMDT